MQNTINSFYKIYFWSYLIRWRSCPLMKIQNYGVYFFLADRKTLCTSQVNSLSSANLINYIRSVKESNGIKTGEGLVHWWRFKIMGYISFLADVKKLQSNLIQIVNSFEYELTSILSLVHHEKMSFINSLVQYFPTFTRQLESL